jgi:NADH-quinone oxidoreductase subunit M
MRQKDLNLLIGNSSVAHMGFVFLGIASATLIGLTGAVMVMVAHGLLAGLAFGLSGYLHQQTRTLDMEKIQGLLAGMPFWGTLMIMALMAGCGLPGFANFAGELTVFFGAWEVYPVITGIAVWSALVIGAVYMLRAIRKLLHGLKGAATPEIEDITSWQRLPYAILLAVLLLFGFYPRLITEKINQSEPTFSQATATQPKDTE